MKHQSTLTLMVLLFFLFSIFITKAQTLEWAYGCEATLNNIHPQIIKSDTKGNVITSGIFINTVDFDPGPDVFNLKSTSAINGFVAKTNSLGKFVWAKSIYSNNDAIVYSIELDNFDNIYLSGRFYDTIDLDPGSGIQKVKSKGQSDAFIIKLDSNGQYLWGKTFGGTSSENAFGITLDESGSIYTTGTFNGTCDFDPGSGTVNLSSFSSEVYVLKLDPTGNFRWVKRVECLGHDVSINICTDKFNNVYFTGGFTGTADFDPSGNIANLSSVNGSDIFICKLDSNGNFRWAKKLGGSRNEQSYRIITDDTGNVYACGAFSGSIDLDPGNGIDNHTTKSESSDLFAIKLDSTGKYKWGYSVGGKGGEMATSIDLDHYNNLYISGSFTDSIDFDAGVGNEMKVPVGSGDAFIVKLKTNGNFEWVRTFGSKKFDAGWSIHVDKIRNIYLVGYYQDTIDFGLGNKYSTKQYDAYFWLKLSQCNIFKNINSISCRQFKFNKDIYTQSGKYFATKSGSNGCDTVYNLTITINKTNPEISKNGNIISVNISGASYKWLNCNNGMQVINDETSQDFKPGASGSYSVVVTLNNCSDTSSCFNFIYSSIQQSDDFSPLKIYPNPGNGFIFIPGISNNSIIKITDQLGRTYKYDLQQNTEFINISNLLQGVYIIEITNDDITYRINYLKI